MLSIRDDRGQRFRLSAPPARIVSLVPSLTELVCTLARADRLIGVTRYCTEPAAVVRARPRVGGTKNPDCVRIIALAPDMVLANSEENRREDVELLEQAGLRVYVTSPTTVRDAERMIERIGRLLDAARGARRLCLGIARSRRRLARLVRGPRWRVFCPIWRNPWMSFNRDTYAHDVLRCAGGRNVCASAAARYPTVDLAQIAAAQPDVVLLPSEPYRFRRLHIDSLRELADTPAWRTGRVFLVDGQALTWYGPRTPAALTYFHRRVNEIR